MSGEEIYHLVIAIVLGLLGLGGIVAASFLMRDDIMSNDNYLNALFLRVWSGDPADKAAAWQRVKVNLHLYYPVESEEDYTRLVHLLEETDRKIIYYSGISHRQETHVTRSGKLVGKTIIKRVG